MLINAYIKESGGVTLEAQVHKMDVSYSVRYFIDGQQVKVEDFDNKSIHFVESAAHNWLEGVKNLNG